MRTVPQLHVLPMPKQYADLYQGIRLLYLLCMLVVQYQTVGHDAAVKFTEACKAVSALFRISSCLNAATTVMLSLHVFPAGVLLGFAVMRTANAAISSGSRLVLHLPQWVGCQQVFVFCYWLAIHSNQVKLPASSA
jgi:hypothetical protein